MASDKRSPVHGVGINDAEYAVRVDGEFVYAGGKRYRSSHWICPIYSAWSSMLKRCYSDKYHAQRPTYRGCTVIPDWHRFSVFRQWMLRQDWSGKHLDKDLLFPGNKLYGPETCVFVSAAVNSFVLDCAASRGKWPIGVNWHSQSGKFRAMCRNPFSNKREHIGLFSSADEAHRAWLKRKHELANLLSAEQEDERVAKALACRYSDAALAQQVKP